MDLDEKLVKQAIKGNEEAFVHLMQMYKVDLYRTAVSFLKSDQEALEAIQEVTYRAFKSIPQLREASYFKTWLIRIMINYCNDQIHQKKRNAGDSHLSIIQLTPPETYSDFELKDALLQLDDRSRELITLKYFHDIKIKDIAVMLKRPEGTVKTWLHKALMSLREQLSEEKEGGDSHVS